MPYLVVLVIAVVVVVLLMRAATASGRSPVRLRPRRPRPSARPVAPDDDPDFLRELERRARREDGTTG